jgi:hypothetical protein
MKRIKGIFMEKQNEIIRHKENPFIKDLDIKVRSKSVKVSKLGKQDNINLINEDTGEHHGTYIGTTKRVDEEQFLKLFTSNIAMTFDLNSAGIKAFNVLCYVMQNTAIEKDRIFIDKYVMEDFNKHHNKKLSKAVLYRGLTELIDNSIIARAQREGEYFINPNFVFNGDRIVFSTIIEKQKKEQKEIGE